MKAKEAENSLYLSEELWRAQGDRSNGACLNHASVESPQWGKGRLLAEERGGLLSGTVRETHQHSSDKKEREREERDERRQKPGAHRRTASVSWAGRLVLSGLERATCVCGAIRYCAGE